MSIINICHDFKYGKIIYNARDRYIGRSLSVYGEYSHNEAELYRQLLRSGDTVIEAGANMGSLTIRWPALSARAAKLSPLSLKGSSSRSWPATRLSTASPTSMPIIRALAPHAGLSSSTIPKSSAPTSIPAG